MKSGLHIFLILFISIGSNVRCHEPQPLRATKEDLDAMPPATEPRICETRNTSSWNDYRIADLFYGHQWIHENRTFASVREEYYANWPTSIGAQYLQYYRFKDLEMLCGIVRERGSRSNDIPAADEAVVHLRLGDVADHEDGNVEWKQGGTWDWSARAAPPSFYIKPKSYYQKALALFPENITVVVVVGSVCHRSSNTSNSIIYRHHVVEYFKKRGYEVRERWDHTPDEDFIFMAHAHLFVAGGGRFSALVRECVGQLGGVTIPD